LKSYAAWKTVAKIGLNQKKAKKSEFLIKPQVANRAFYSKEENERSGNHAKFGSQAFN